MKNEQELSRVAAHMQEELESKQKDIPIELAVVQDADR